MSDTDNEVVSQSPNSHVDDAIRYNRFVARDSEVRWFNLSAYGETESPSSVQVRSLQITVEFDHATREKIRKALYEANMDSLRVNGILLGPKEFVAVTSGQGGTFMGKEVFLKKTPGVSLIYKYTEWSKLIK